MTKIKPFRNYILVKPYPVEEKTSGGIILPDSFKERNTKAEIVAIGEGTPALPMTLKTGWAAYHVKGAGTKIEEDGEVYFLMPDRDVLAYEEN